MEDRLFVAIGFTNAVDSVHRHRLRASFVCVGLPAPRSPFASPSPSAPFIIDLGKGRGPHGQTLL